MYGYGGYGGHVGCGPVVGGPVVGAFNNFGVGAVVVGTLILIAIVSIFCFCF